MAENKTAIKSGSKTTEFKKTKEATWTFYISMALGLLIAHGPALVGNLDSGSLYAVIAGAAVAMAGIGQKMLIDLGYIKSRTDVKVSNDQKK